MRHFEINGNLDTDVDDNLFCGVVCNIMDFFISVFGDDLMSSIDLFVDNATSGSGYTPITIPILKKYVMIKLHIEKNSTPYVIAFQFSHELMHYVFYASKGIDKKIADEREESICTAVSLIVLKEFYPDGFEIQNKHVKTLQNEGYRRGADLAADVNYDMQQIKNMI